MADKESTPAALRMGLRTKFILAFAIQAVVMALVIVAIQQYRVRKAIVDQTVEQGAAIAQAVQSTAGYYVTFNLIDDLNRVINRLRVDPSVEYVDFIAADGRRLVSGGTRNLLTAKSMKSAMLKNSQGEILHLFVQPFVERGKTEGYLRLVINEKDAHAAARSLLKWNLAICLLAVFLSIGLAYFASQFIVLPILELARSAKLIAHGDLTQRTHVETGDEIGALADAFNQMAANLEQTVTQVVRSQTQLKMVVESVGTISRAVIDRVDRQRAVIDETYHSIDKLNSGVRTITDNVETLSASSEETSSSMLEMIASMEEVGRHTDTLFNSVEETASATHQMVSSINEVDQNAEFLTSFVTETSSSMVEMSASIAQVETNAARSYDLSSAVATAAESGMKAVRETMEGMEQIRQSVSESNAVVSRLGERSVAIGKILNVIEDVAEQTNLLALNAAILAAQAGEYGRGFSVVAGEIRELSERTATSTKEISTLIKSVQHEVGNALKTMSTGSKLVEQGVMLSHEAGKTLNKILESATKASGMGKEIAGATREQAKGSETVTESVDRLQDMVRQISAATTQQAQGSDHILKAVESMREVTKYVRQAMVEQKSGSSMISAAAERMIDMIHSIFQVAANQAGESEKIVTTVEQVRVIAESNRGSAYEMSSSISLLDDAIRGLDEHIRKFTVRA